MSDLEIIMSLCAIAVTVCISLLVYNNLAATKKIASDTAKDVAVKFARKTFVNVQQIKPKDNTTAAQDLYEMALITKDKQVQLVYLEEADKICEDADLKGKIRIMKNAVIKAIEKEDDEFLKEF